VQTIANLIAAEARLNDHSFDNENTVFKNLIRQEELAVVTYALSNYLGEILPAGMTEHEIYILH